MEIFRLSSLSSHEPKRALIEACVAGAVQQANRAGKFYRNTADIRDFPRDALLSRLRQRRYDCFVALENGEFAALLGYQANPPGEPRGWHAFAFHTQEQFENRGYMSTLIHIFLCYWKVECDVNRVRLGAGDESGSLVSDDAARARHMVEKAIGGKFHLPFGLRPVSGEQFGWLESYWPIDADVNVDTGRVTEVSRATIEGMIAVGCSGEDIRRVSEFVR